MQFFLVDETMLLPFHKLPYNFREVIKKKTVIILLYTTVSHVKNYGDLSNDVSKQELCFEAMVSEL